uniref:hypothetical protein n=1 Tax=Rhodococcus phenolicus TaxID=263849 RepID=UPI000A58A9C3
EDRGTGDGVDELRYGEWTAHTTRPFDFLAVCSDETVAEPDAAVANTSDLGFPVTTEPKEIVIPPGISGGLLSREDETYGSRIEAVLG